MLMPESLKVLVTGGAGFIGSHFVDYLVKDGNEVKIIDNLSVGSLDNLRGCIRSGKVDFVNGDIRDGELVKKCVKDVDVAVHFAALTSVPFSVSNPELTFDVNLFGTFNLLSSCAQAGVGKFVFVSSCAVYGNLDPACLPVTENCKPNPISPYAESKLIAERYCLGFSERQLLRSVVLRFFNVYGPRQGLNEYSGVITRFLERVTKRKPLVIYGDGSQTRDFVNVSDIVQAVNLAMRTDGADGQIYHVGSGIPTSINELAKTMLELAGLDLDIRQEEYRVGDIKYSYADISKAKKFLGYVPMVTLREGLRTLLKENRVAT